MSGVLIAGISSLLGALVVLVYVRFFHKFANGNTIYEVKTIFRRDLLRCNTWKTRTVFNLFSMTVTRGCPGDKFEYNMITGVGSHIDTDMGDGCGESDDWDFSIGQSSKNPLKKVILRKR